MRRSGVGFIEKHAMAASEGATCSMQDSMPCAAWRRLKEMERYLHGVKN